MARGYCTYHALVYLCVVAAVAQLGYGVVNQSAIPPYMQSIGLTIQIGLTYTVFLAFDTVFKSPMGFLSDKFGRRPLIVCGALISASTSLGMAFADKLWEIMALRAFDGVAVAAIMTTLIAAVGGCVGKEQRTTAMSVVTVAYITGVALGPYIGGVANDTTGSKTTSFFLASVVFVMTAVVALFLTPHRSKEEEEEPASKGTHGTHVRFRDIAIAARTVPDMMVTAFMGFFGIGLLVPVAKLFGMNELGLTERGYGELVMPVACTVGVASFVAGRLGDRWGKALSVRLGLAIAALAMWANTVAQRPLEFAAAGILLGSGFILAMPAWLALVADMASPRIRGSVIGALGTAQGVGGLIGAVLGSILYDRVQIGLFGMDFGQHRSPFVVSALALTACFIMVWIFVREHDPRRIGVSEVC